MLLCESVGVAVSEVMSSIKEPLSAQRHDVTSRAINKGEIAHHAPDNSVTVAERRGPRHFFYNYHPIYLRELHLFVSLFCNIPETSLRRSREIPPLVPDTLCFPVLTFLRRRRS